MLTKCPECARSVSDMAVMCPGCGYDLSRITRIRYFKPLREHRFFLKWAPVFVVCFVAVLIFEGGGKPANTADNAQFVSISDDAKAGAEDSDGAKPDTAIPVRDIDDYCSTYPAHSTPPSTSEIKQCVEDEGGAYNNLTTIWSRLDDETKKKCAGGVMIDAPYETILKCSMLRSSHP